MYLSIYPFIYLYIIRHKRKEESSPKFAVKSVDIRVT